MQLQLPFTARARRTDPQTSHDAAATVKVEDSHKLVLEALQRASEPLTSWQVAERIAGISDSRVRGALSELCRVGRVRVVDHEGLSPSFRAASRYAVK